jgi:hypothetical protein
MNSNLIFSIGALVASVFTTWKIIVEMLRGRHGHLREEYKFAREFFKDVADHPNMHPFLKQKGYQAIAGDTQISSNVIEYLLTLTNSSQALKDFVFGRSYLTYLTTASATGFQIAFRKKYMTKRYRTWRKVGYFLLFMVCYLIGSAPLLLPIAKAIPPAQSLTIFATAALLFFPPSFFALREGVRIARAEVLVENQYKHGNGVTKI